MKDRKKPRGTKARVQASKERLSYIGAAITVAILITIIVVSSFLTYSFLNPSPNQTVNPDQTNNQPSQLKAAIVDHLSLTWSNQTFIQNATNTLEQAGYTVDYYPGEEVNVEFYRNLPTHGYGLIILRVHSSAMDIGGTESPVAFFTSERISQTKYVYEQLTDQLVGVAYSVGDKEKGISYFGIGPLFVTNSMNGRFQNTTIIMMGCEGLDNPFNPLMAMAFVEKGAKVYIGWNQPVTVSHTDQATTQLLQHLTIEKQTIKQAVTETMNKVGSNLTYTGVLQYYPLEAGEQTIESINVKTENPSVK